MGMEWFTLDDQFRPSTPIEGFQSFIWTERYATAGDFQIVTTSTHDNRQLLQPETYIGRRGSDYTMKIDTVTDVTDDKGVRTLTVTGKSLEFLLDDRVAMPGQDDLATTPSWTITGAPADIARELFNRVCVEGVIDDHDSIPFYTFGTVNPEGNLGEPPDVITVTISPDTLYNVLTQLCTTYSLGFRFVRKPGATDNPGIGVGSVSMGKMSVHGTGSGVTTGGSSSNIQHIGANGGPDGAAGQTQTQFVDAQTQIGPGTMIKIFYNTTLNLWTQASSSGVTPSAVIAAYPNVIPVLCWNDTMTQAQMTTFINSVPTGQKVILCWQQEAENSTDFANGGEFLNGVSGNPLRAGWIDQANKIRAAGNPNMFTAVCSTWGRYQPTGTATDGAYLPPANLTDYYFMDIYQHQAGGNQFGATTWPSNGLANHAGFQKWRSLVKAKGAGVKMGITEYGVDDTGTITARHDRILLDYNYLQNSGDIWFCLIYWWHNMAASNTKYKFTDTATMNMWKGFVTSVGT